MSKELDKAKAIIEQHFKAITSEDLTEHDKSFMAYYTSKQNAIIHVKGILDEICFFYPNRELNHKRILFWTNVEKELNNI